MHVARRTTLSAAVVAALAGTVLPAAAQHFSPGPARASVATDGRQADGASAEPALSANGRYIAFVSAAANLVRGDTNGVADVFVHDLRTGRTQRVAEGPATGVALSGDGRDVVFATTAALTEDDDNGLDDIYLYDRRTHRTERVSHGHPDAPPRSRLNYSPAISANGRIVAYTTATPDAAPGDTNGRDDVIVHDRRTGKNELVQYRTDGTLGDGDSLSASLSADGRQVAFETADQLDPNHDWTHARNVYVRDRLKGTTEQISRPTRFVYKESSFDSSISANGRMFAFSSNVASLVPDDTNKVTDVFAFDRKTQTTVRVSTAADGTQADGVSAAASLSGDGRRVAFVSAATNLVPGDTNGLADVFVKDLRTGAVERVSVAADGTEADRPAVGSTSLSDHRIAFSSAATNLVRGDTNDTVDVFVGRDHETNSD
ncbi:TolB family protein [Streptomyces sp. NPDC096311]|uniref:TolB family protein n=1 Tax=Streptomyces sp. NPDC096311 TaxID=3366083 RepID=UPI00381373BB